MAFCSKCGKELPAAATFCPACGTPVTASGASTAPVSGFETLTKDTKAQSYWVERLIAFFIDAVIVLVAFAIIAALISVPFLFSGGPGVFGLVFSTLWVLEGLVLVLYFAIFETSSGATIGKRIFSLKVKSKTGGNPTFGEAFIRNLSKLYWLLLLLDVIVGLAVSKGYQQKYSDSFIGTTVVSTKA